MKKLFAMISTVLLLYGSVLAYNCTWAWADNGCLNSLCQAQSPGTCSGAGYKFTKYFCDMQYSNTVCCTCEEEVYDCIGSCITLFKYIRKQHQYETECVRVGTSTNFVCEGFPVPPEDPPGGG